MTATGIAMLKKGKIALLTVAGMFGMAASAATNITGTVTLGTDADWSEYDKVVVNGSLDLAGHILKVAALDGAGTITSSHTEFFDLTDTDSTRVTMSTNGVVITDDDLVGSAQLPAWKLFANYTSYSTADKTRFIYQFSDKNSIVPLVIDYDFRSPTCVNCYKIRTLSQIAGRGPGEWLFQGSSDGENWTTLDAHTGMSFASSETKTFCFFNEAEYRHYRLQVNSNTANTENFQFFSLEYGVSAESAVTLSPGGAAASSFGSLTISDPARVAIVGNGALTGDAVLKSGGDSPFSIAGTLDLNGHDLSFCNLSLSDSITNTSFTGSIVNSTFDLTGTGTSSCTNTFTDNAAAAVFSSTGRVIWYMKASGNTQGIVIDYEFPDATVIDTYRITNWGNNQANKRGPKAWTVSGSMDGTAWTELHARADEPNWDYNVVRTYAFDNAIAFRHYRIHFTASQAAEYLQFRQLEYGCRKKLHAIPQDGVAKATLSVPQSCTLGVAGTLVPDLGGNTLAVEISDEATLELPAGLYNGEVEFVGGAVNFPNETVMTNVDISVNSALTVGGDISVRNYAALYEADGNGGTSALDVYGVFTPATDYFYGCTLKDGASIDLSSRSTPLNVVSSATAGATTLLFAENAVIDVVLGARRVATGTRLIEWTNETKPSGVTFRRGDANARYRLDTRDDGVYYVGNGLVIIVK